MASQNPKSKIQNWLLWFALALLAGLLLLKVADSARLMGELFVWPHQLDESESMIVAETGLLDHGTNIWNRPGPDLFISAPYPPLYYLLNWPILHFVGASFKVGRALSILLTLVAGGLIAAIVAQITRDRVAGGLAALVWGSIGVVAFWGALVKPDMLAVACGLGGLWWLLARPSAQVWAALPFFWGAVYSKQTALAAAGAACGWLLLTRPRTGALFTGVFLAGILLPAGALNLLTDGGYSYHLVTLHDLPWYGDRFANLVGGFLLAYGAWLGLGMLAILVALARDGLTAWRGWRGWRERPSPLTPLPARGERGTPPDPPIAQEGASLSTAVPASMMAEARSALPLTTADGERGNPPDPPIAQEGASLSTAVPTSRMAEARSGAPLTPGVGAESPAPRTRGAGTGGRGGARYPGLLLTGYLALALVAAGGAGTLGGNHNHFLEWVAAGCLGFGLAIRGLWALPGVGGRVTAVLVVLLLALQVGALYRTPNWLGYELRAPGPSVAEGLRNITQYVTNDPGTAYSDNVGLLLNAGKRLWTTDPFTQTHATFYGRWDESALVAAIRQRAFSLIILRTDLFDPQQGQGDVSPGIATAIRDTYTIDQRNVEFIYKPKR